MQRRDFLIDLTRIAALAAIVPNDWRVVHRPRFADDPFALGLASGDPSPAGAMLWTRLAPRPLDPHGGMNGSRAAVTWEVADDEGFTKIVQQGRATAVPELAYSVHVDVKGLAPDRWYYYRFHSGQATSGVGRVRTAPAEGAQTPLRLAFASCQHYEQGFYTAQQHLANEEIDAVAFLGDYIYEYGPNTANPRLHATAEVMDLEGYRGRYAQYKSDPALQAAHAAFPWLLITDDHEVDNNYAGLVSENEMESTEWMHARRAAAYQAWWEHQPVRVPHSNSWADLVQMRRLDWGALARIHLLDGRQYRSDQPCGDGDQAVPCGDWADPKHTMFGPDQEKWLSSGLASSRAHWQILANQVMFAPFDLTAGPTRTYHMDSWGGYPAAADRLLDSIGKYARNRTVLISGDIHSNWVNEIHARFTRDETPIVAAEFVGTSFTSGGDGSDRNAAVGALAAENPHLKWQNNRRGYVVCRFDGDVCEADYRIVPYVSKPGAPIQTATRWKTEHGKAGITQL
ncbi:MAG TPA: alkaline phosphatase D family protein [Gemmatimonadaceae bacterium]|nr:alkaline phosphatase D family protein [Gemmatimonadaceae bacterium]